MEVLKRFLGKDIMFDYVDVIEIFFRKDKKSIIIFSSNYTHYILIICINYYINYTY